MNFIPQMDRRSFVVGASAAGLALGFHIPFSDTASAQTAPEVNAWVVIKPDDSVIIRIAKSEMGQGTLTGLAQMVAEELECDWSKVSTEFPTPGQNLARNRVWGDFFTAGSRGIRSSHELVRKGGAAARIMLLKAAGDAWEVPVAELTVANGIVTHKASNRSTTYGKLADAAAKIAPPADVPLKDPKDWQLIGKGVKRLDTPDKVTGKQAYCIDIKVPGMLNAAIRQCPVFGGKLKSYDAAKAEGMKGVKKVVKVGDDAVAVVADTWWRAKTALHTITFDWDFGDNGNASTEQFAEVLRAGLDAPQAFEGNTSGDIKAAIAGAAKKVEAVYAVPHQNHATMEVQNAIAIWTPDSCEVWTPTQNGESALAITAAAAGHPVAKCDVHKMILGGGFGRRSAGHDWLEQTIAIAKQMPGTPIKLIWSREDDMMHGKYHPVTMCKLTGALDANNNLVGFAMRISGQSILASVAPQSLQNGKDSFVFQGLNAQGPEGQFGYSIPNILIDHAMRNPTVPPGFWRGVNNNQNAIYLECFMDELAKETNTDPLEFRRKLMANHPKHLAVLNAVAERIGWDKPAPSGVFRGLAQHMGYGSYVAACAEVSVTGNKVKIHRIVAATDPGYAVNPAQIERQVAGSFVFGLSALFYGGITIKNGRVQEENFDTYGSMRINEMPKVETIVMPSGGFWGGVGEPTIFVAAPAVLNAMAAATGTRYRSFPLKQHGFSLS